MKEIMTEKRVNTLAAMARVFIILYPLSFFIYVTFKLFDYFSS